MLEIKEITYEKLKQKIVRYVCPLYLKVPREPYETPCRHSFERTLIVPFIRMSKICPSCKEPVDVEDLRDNFERKDAITILRHEIKLTYPKLSDQDKKKWKPIID
jgi:hypothetical protein